MTVEKLISKLQELTENNKKLLKKRVKIEYPRCQGYSEDGCGGGGGN